ncbi:MAG TPA: [FeFe] hydrogenase, group A [Clostridia bacterium]|nr:[FeFe] hydrogenase, group A [Clostridia bacterium]
MRIFLDGEERQTDNITVLELLKKEGKDFYRPDGIEEISYINNDQCPLVNIAEIDGGIYPANVLKNKAVKEGMDIRTSSPLVKERLQQRISLLSKNHECFLIRKAQEFVACEADSAQLVDLEERKTWRFETRVSEPSVVHDPNKCIRCGSCVETCREQSVEALRMDEKEGVIIDESKCVRCGQCVLNCPFGYVEKYMNLLTDWLGCGLCAFSRPVGAFSERDDVAKVINALKDPDKYVVIEIAPSIRSTIGEEFGAKPGTVVTRKLYAALREIGFDRIWDTNFSADLTIMEEGYELIGRVKDNGVLPQFTSCCPGWIKFCETYYPELIPHLSSAKSPQQMFGAIAKTYAAQELNIDPDKMFVVSVMPCTAKKYERDREEFMDAYEYWKEKERIMDKFPDVDVVLSTRECAKLIKMFNLDLLGMPEQEADSMLGEYTGAAPIFGRTGGVMTAALRTAYEVIEGKPLEDIELEALGRYEGIKTASIPTGVGEIKIAVTSGLSNARLICEDIKKGGEFSKYHFIEIMTCPGGCVGGGGQIVTPVLAKKLARAAGLNEDDRNCPIRKSHENPDIKELYNDFLDEPCGELSHHLLHTHYVRRDGR